MKLNKYKPSKRVEKDVPSPRPTWEDMRDKEPLPNIHGINRHYKESPEVVKERLDISDSYRGKLDGRTTRENSMDSMLERLPGIVKRFQKKRDKR